MSDATPPDLRRRLDRVLQPRSIAVVGDKGARDYLWLKSMKRFRGTLYSVQLDEQEIPGIEALGVPNYTSLTAIPEPVDYVVCAAPRQVTPHIVQDCIDANAGGVALFTSGFTELGDETGIELEEELVKMARGAGLPLIGPNCMGLHIPALGVRFSPEQPTAEGGDVSFISQSGTHGLNFSLVGAVHGIYCSKMISFGNGAVLEAADFLDYLADDPATTVIAMYIEGVRDGERFARTLRAVAARKPVVIWKGGQTDVGQRATQSHTASLTTSQRVWSALVKQAGAITADNLDELIDIVKTLRMTKPPSGRRAALVAMTGGQSVVIADAFGKAGLEVPLLSDASYAEFGEFVSVIGGSYKNPLDLFNTMLYDPGAVERVLAILDRDPVIDSIVFELSAYLLVRRWEKQPAQFEALLDTLQRFNAHSTKPLVTIIYPAHVEAKVLELRTKLQARGVATFPTFERAAAALAKITEYHLAHT